MTNPPNELHIGPQRKPVTAEGVQRLAATVDNIATALGQSEDGRPLYDAARVLYEVAKLMTGPEPLSFSSGLAPQPAAPIDQIEAISFHHSASALAAIATIRDVALELLRAQVPVSTVAAGRYACLLSHALGLLGARVDPKVE